MTRSNPQDGRRSRLAGGAVPEVVADPEVPAGGRVDALWRWIGYRSVTAESDPVPGEGTDRASRPVALPRPRVLEATSSRALVGLRFG